MAAIYAEHDGSFDLVASIGIPPKLLNVVSEMAWLPVGMANLKLLHVGLDSRAARLATNPSSSGDGHTHALFAVAAKTKDSRRVVLAVITDGSQYRLSAAQGYCLQAYIAHVTTLLEVDADKVVFEDDYRTRQRIQSERLRLLESVAVHARDSIIITEAEPIDLPGPRIIYCNAAFTVSDVLTPQRVSSSTA